MRAVAILTFDRMSVCACQIRLNGLSARPVERFCVQRKKEKFSAKLRHVGRYGGRNHVCNIW